MKERTVIKCLESVATMWYKRTHDEWWLKIAIASMKKREELHD